MRLKGLRLCRVVWTRSFDRANAPGLVAAGARRVPSAERLPRPGKAEPSPLSPPSCTTRRAMSSHSLRLGRAGARVGVRCALCEGLCGGGGGEAEEGGQPAPCRMRQPTSAARRLSDGAVPDRVPSTVKPETLDWRFAFLRPAARTSAARRLQTGRSPPPPWPGPGPPGVRCGGRQVLGVALNSTRL